MNKFRFAFRIPVGLRCGTRGRKEFPVRSIPAEDREFTAIYCDFGDGYSSAIVDTRVAPRRSTDEANSALNIGFEPNESKVAQRTVKAGKVVAVAFIALLWLPVTIMFSTMARGFSIPLDPEIWLSLWPTIFAGLPLAAACWLIYKRGNGRAAIITFLLAGVVTVLAAIIGGLFGPVGIFAYCAAASVPAWVVWITISVIDKVRSRRQQ